MPCTKTLVDMNYPQELYLLLNLHVREGSTYNLSRHEDISEFIEEQS